MPFQYNFAGKFTAPTPEWMHQTRELFDYELFVVTRGTLHIAAEDEHFSVETGQYLLMPPTPRQHGDLPSDCDFYWLHFAPLSPCETLDAVNVPEADALSLLIPVTGTLRSLHRMVIHIKHPNSSEPRYGLRSMNNFHTSVILSELSAQCTVSRRYHQTADNRQLYQDVVDYITRNICQNLKVADIAQYFGYNEKYLTTYFRRHGSVSIKQFVLLQKMEHAKAELSETNHTIAQIAYNIGYTDPHNFSNAFKKVTGLTPSDYRESYSQRRLYQV